jgi:hypothetical protein
VFGFKTQVIIVEGGEQIIVANSTALSAIVASTLPDGTVAYVTSKDAWFRLETSARATNTYDTFASTVAGRQWLRLGEVSLKSAARTSWEVDPGAGGSDDNTGAPGSPLKTMSELSWRLARADLTAAVSVALLASMATTDKPIFTFRVRGSGSFSITGTTTVLFTGAVTTYTAAAAAPAADQATVLDNSLPVSWTASGLLVSGVLCRRTTAATSFFIAKDNGAKTARISEPFGGALANGNAYQALQLPTIQQMRFEETAIETVTITNCMTAAGSQWFDSCLLFVECWFQTGQFGAFEALQCAWSGDTNINLQPGASVALLFGMMRGTGTTQVISTIAQLAITGPFTTQGAALIIQSGFLSLAGDLRVYDMTRANTGCLTANYWGIVYWNVGALSGTGNTTLLLYAGRFSQIGYAQAPVAVAGSSTNATPLRITGTGDIAVAALPANVNVQQNGIFLSQ